MVSAVTVMELGKGSEPVLGSLVRFASEPSLWE